MTCNVIWLRQALAAYQDRLNNVLLVTAAEIPALEWRRDNGQYIPRAQFMAFDGTKYIVVDNRQGQFEKETKETLHASVIVTLHSLRHDFKWGAKRLQDLQQYIHDTIDAVLKSHVPIWEFMKCLHVECGIDYPALTAYEKQFGPVDIYRGNRGER